MYMELGTPLPPVILYCIIVKKIDGKMNNCPWLCKLSTGKRKPERISEVALF